jgi:hypothetical protein
MARPRKAPEARRTYLVRVYLTDDEADTAYRAAFRAGRDSLSEHVRTLLGLPSLPSRKTTTSSGTRRLALP